MNLNRAVSLLVIIINLLGISNIYAQHKELKPVATLPETADAESNYGLAGAFIGTINNKVIVAGGSNFSKGFPWQGGAKQFKDEIYVVTNNNDNYSVELIENVKFPGGGIAHGVSGVVNNKLYCFGGTRTNNQSDSYYIIEERNNQINVEKRGDLPAGFSPVATSIEGDNIYIHGVKSGKNSLYCYNTETTKWSECTALPAATRNAGATFIADNNKRETTHYLIGGRNTDGDNLTIFSDVWRYDSANDIWTYRGYITIDNTIQTRVYASIAHNKNGKILLIGGDDGKMFTKLYNLEREIANTDQQNKIDSLKSVQRSLQTTHKGFTSNVLSYDPKRNRWSEELKYSTPLPVVTTATILKDKILVTSGEISPGVRTPHIYEIK